MQQNSKTNHTEVLSIEEYLTRRKEIKAKDKNNWNEQKTLENLTWVLAEC